LRQVLFHDDADADYFIEILKRYKQKLNFLVYHWCLMPNHYHLLIEISQPPLISKIVGACQQIYVSYYHRKYNTAGKLFQNRFKSQAIEGERYLIACGRYIELNPVRAKLVKSAWDWKWSSARFYVKGEADSLTSVDPEWKDSSPESYKKWISDSMAAEAEGEIFSSSQSIIGDKDFKNGLIIEDGRPRPKPFGRPKKKNGRQGIKGKSLE
jgi:REP element-mobilizing transposase RayT